jgi:hypothetical protein
VCLIRSQKERISSCRIRCARRPIAKAEKELHSHEKPSQAHSPHCCAKIEARIENYNIVVTSSAEGQKGKRTG